MKYLVIAALIGSAMARPDGAGGHHGGGHHGGHHSAPAAAAPSTGYEQPATGYEQPATGYEQPSSGYAEPAYEQTGYDSGYDYPAATGRYAPAPADSGIDMNMILIPILIIAGLALLFPSVTTVPVNTMRRRRSAEEGELHKQHAPIIFQ